MIDTLRRNHVAELIETKRNIVQTPKNHGHDGLVPPSVETTLKLQIVTCPMAVG